MFIVLRTNTNHEDSAFGPYDSEEEAKTTSHQLGEDDHLFEHKVLEVLEFSPEEEEDEEEDHEMSKAELMERAAELEIVGRSSMNKEELAAAIEEAEASDEEE